jgi:hypothetical protein
MPTVQYHVCPGCGTQNLPGRTHCLGCSQELPALPAPVAVSAGVEMESAPRPRQPSEVEVIVGWSRAYCRLLIVCNLLGSLFAGSLLSSSLRYGGGGDSLAPILAFYTLVGIVQAGFVAVALFLPRTPQAWTYHVVVQCLGLWGCSLPFAVILLIHWFRPDVKAWFGRETSA